jgi:hypothetical protein
MGTEIYPDMSGNRLSTQQPLVSNYWAMALSDLAQATAGTMRQPRATCWGVPKPTTQLLQLPFIAVAKR